MEYSSFRKRLLVGILDYITMGTIFNLISAILVINLDLGKGDMQMAPFVIIVMTVMPLDIIRQFIFNPTGYGKDLGAYILLFILMIFVEVIYNIVIDILSVKKFNGNKISSINLRNLNNNNSPSYFKIIIRNILKPISRILLFIPFITMIFSENNQTVYDKMTGIVVLSKENK